MSNRLRLLSKAQLATIFGVSLPTLRTKVFTDKVLEQLQITQEEWRTLRVFSAAQSKQIISIFEIAPEELD